MTQTVLDVEELHALAVDLAARPGTWREHVRHDPSQRHFHELLSTEHAVAWLICWMPGHDTGFHDHVPGPDGVLQRHRVPEGAELRSDALFAVA